MNILNQLIRCHLRKVFFKIKKKWRKINRHIINQEDRFLQNNLINICFIDEDKKLKVQLIEQIKYNALFDIYFSLSFKFNRKH